MASGQRNLRLSKSCQHHLTAFSHYIGISVGGQTFMASIITQFADCAINCSIDHALSVNPLAIAGVGPAWTLVESRRMKTLFVRKALQDIKLGDFEIVNDRLENVAEGQGRAGAFDGFTSRATLAMKPTLALASRLVRLGGSAFLWKVIGWERERERDPAWRSDWDFDRVEGVGTGPNVVARLIRTQLD